MKPVVKRDGPNGIHKVKKEKSFLDLTGKFGTDVVKNIAIKEGDV